jgi:hypothetical protein
MRIDRRRDSRQPDSFADYGGRCQRRQAARLMVRKNLNLVRLPIPPLSRGLLAAHCCRDAGKEKGIRETDAF